MNPKYIENKKLVAAYGKELSSVTTASIHTVLDKYCRADIAWNGPQPFNAIKGTSGLAEIFWKPFLAAFPYLRRDAYILFSGKDPLFEDKEWVVTAGNYVGDFQHEWLGMPPTKGAIWIRYVEFDRIEGDRICETYTLLDIFDVMRQAGLRFNQALAPEIVTPGPWTNDGIIMCECDETESKKSYDIVRAMTFTGLTSFKDKGIGKMGLERYFSRNFMWYGPAGIGTTIGIKGFEDYHQKPFLKALPDRMPQEKEESGAMFAEGNYCGLFTWTGFTATHTGPDWLGLAPTGKRIVMRCSDLYRRDGAELVENWVYMDLIDILLQMGIDVFAKIRR
jgi:predicted ester cyclase